MIDIKNSKADTIPWDCAPGDATHYLDEMINPWLMLEDSKWYNYAFGQWFFVDLCENQIEAITKRPDTLKPVIAAPMLADKPPIYTKEMHDNGELPPIGSKFIVNIPNHESGCRVSDFHNKEVRVLSLSKPVIAPNTKDTVIITIEHNNLGVGAIYFDTSYIKPIETRLKKQIAFDDYMSNMPSVGSTELYAKMEVVFYAGIEYAKSKGD